jgi:hypothetical protein
MSIDYSKLLNSNLIFLEANPVEAQMQNKKQDLSDASKCTDAIVLGYSRKYNTSKSVGQKVEYGYLKRLIDEKKNKFGVNCSISSKTIKKCIQEGILTAHHGAESPFDKVEAALVQICIQMGNLSAPILHQSHCTDE